jgi:hypothetical protein
MEDNFKTWVELKQERLDRLNSKVGMKLKLIKRKLIIRRIFGKV